MSEEIIMISLINSKNARMKSDMISLVTIEIHNQEDSEHMNVFKVFMFTDTCPNDRVEKLSTCRVKWSIRILIIIDSGDMPTPYSLGMVDCPLQG